MHIARAVRHTLPIFGLVALVASGVLALDTLKQVPVPPVASVSAARVVALTNEERTDDGIRLLFRNSLLDRAAQMKAEDMAAKGYYAHVSPEGSRPCTGQRRRGTAT